MDTVEILGEQLIYSGRKIRLKKLNLLIRGSKTFHEIVEFGESVAILPITSDGKVILERQFRGPIRDWLVEIPAGKIEKGEDPSAAAIRELREETGYKAKSVEFLGSFYLTPGYSTERIHLFVAEDLEFVGQSLEEHEAIKTFQVKFEDLLNDVLSGKINDGKTALATLLYAFRKGLVKWSGK